MNNLYKVYINLIFNKYFHVKSLNKCTLVFVVILNIFTFIFMMGCSITQKNQILNEQTKLYITKVHKIFDQMKFDFYKAKDVVIEANKLILKISDNNDITYYTINNKLYKSTSSQIQPNVIAENIDCCYFYRNSDLPSLVTIIISFIPDTTTLSEISSSSNYINMPFITSFALRNYPQ